MGGGPGITYHLCVVSFMCLLVSRIVPDYFVFNVRLINYQ